MPKLINLLNENRMTLMVALPENDPELAEAAVRGGADALQLHVNVSHFKTFYEEKKSLKQILENTVIPVGIVPGLDVTADKDEMEEMKKIGFDFFNMDMEKVPAFMMELKGISRVLALNERYTLDKLMASDHKADALDAAIISASGKGKDLVVGDLHTMEIVRFLEGDPIMPASFTAECRLCSSIVCPIQASLRSASRSLNTAAWA